MITDPSTGAVRKQREPKGKSNTWPGKTADILLSLCKAHRKDLRQRFVPVDTLIDIEKSLKEMNLVYSVDDIKKKLCTLKRTFGDCKQGKNGGLKWKHFNVMSYIYDEVLEGEGKSVPDKLSY